MAEKTENVKQEVKKIQMTPEMAKNIIGMSRKNLNSVLSRKAQVEQFLIGLDGTLANIDALKGNKEEQGMINLGNGVYVSLKFPEKINNALFVIGNDIMIEKEFTDITKTLTERKIKLQKEYEILIRQEAELTDNLNKLYFYMNNISKKQEKVE